MTTTKFKLGEDMFNTKLNRIIELNEKQCQHEIRYLTIEQPLWLIMSINFTHYNNLLIFRGPSQRNLDVPRLLTSLHICPNTCGPAKQLQEVPNLCRVKRHTLWLSNKVKDKDSPVAHHQEPEQWHKRESSYQNRLVQLLSLGVILVYKSSDQRS